MSFLKNKLSKLSLYQNIFLLLPSLIVVGVISDKIPVTSWLLQFSQNWRQFFRKIFQSIIEAIPFLPEIEIPNLVLDEITFCSLLIASIGLPKLISRQFNWKFDSSSKAQVSPKVYWVAVVLLAGILFFSHHLSFFYIQLEERTASSPSLFSVMIALQSWALAVLFLISDVRVPLLKSKSGGVFALLIIGITQFSLTWYAIRGSITLTFIVVLITAAVGSILLYLRENNRNSVVIILVFSVTLFTIGYCSSVENLKMTIHFFEENIPFYPNIIKQ